MAIMRRLTVLAGAAEAVRRYMRNNPEKVNRFAERAGRFVDKRTKGKYARQVDGAVRTIRSTAGKNNHHGYRH
jgi:hypothetical protein